MALDAGATSRLPTGTVTFLRTDVEGSMALAFANGAAWDEINGTHLDALREAVERHAGVVVRTEGDALFAAFGEAGAAVRAATDGQRAIETRSWPPGATVRVRMGLHTGEAHLAGDDYGGFDVNRVARIAAVGHGGQIVLSGSTHALVGLNPPAGVRFRDLGRHALKDVPVPEHLFQVEMPGLQADFPPLRATATTAGNLPDRLTSFVGRSEDLAELEALLGSARLLTLTGPGGIGKTSLAIELARRHADSVPDGAWLVELEAVADPDAVTAAIARTVGLFDGADGTAATALPGFLADRSVLLVLDTFEHLVDAAGEVATLVRASPRSRFVVTSRSPLHVSGEHEYPVRSLPVAGATADPASDRNAAAQLFADRARAVRPGWDPVPDAGVVTEICELLDGLPLGIELAAARMSLLPATAIRDRLAAHLSLPGSGPRDAPARQRTLDAAIAWSNDLLAPADQQALRALSVFEGGFDAEQAGRVLAADADDAEAIDRLVGLADRSLLTRQAIDPGPAGYLVGTGIRFAMLRTIQAFAGARLVADGTEAETRRRHAAAYLDLAQAAAQHLPGSGQPAWLDRLALDEANLRAALSWAVESGEVETSLRFVAAMWRFWQLDGHLVEGRTWADAVLAMPGADAPTPARLGAITAAGGIAYWQGGRELSVRLYREQLSLAEQLGDAAAVADAHLNLASATFVEGNIAEAKEHAEAARSCFVELGDEVGINRMDWGLSNIAYAFDRTTQGIEVVEAIRQRAIELDDMPTVMVAEGSLAWGWFARGDAERAGTWAVRAMMTSYGMRDVASTSISLPMGAIMLTMSGRPADAARLMGAHEALCRQYGVQAPIGIATIIRQGGPIERLQAVLGPDELEGLLAEGRKMTLAEAMEIVGSWAADRAS